MKKIILGLFLTLSVASNLFAPPKRFKEVEKLIAKAKELGEKQKEAARKKAEKKSKILLITGIFSAVGIIAVLATVKFNKKASEFVKEKYKKASNYLNGRWRQFKNKN